MLALFASAALTADVWPSIAGSVAPHEQNLPLVEMQRAPTAQEIVDEMDGQVSIEFAERFSSRV